jgi:alkylation response protein AidB-like acyl-CoA dehydrogenase
VENARAQLGAQLGARSVLAERARDLVPLVDKHADFADEEGVLADDVVAALHRDGLFGLWVPEVLGGSELDPLGSLEVIETLSYGDPSVGWVVMAASLSITLIENWDVLGLRGTGSIDYTIDQVFVPEAYTHFATTDTPRRGGSLYHIGIIGFAEICHSGWALGVGRRMLDELVLLVQSKQGRPGTQADNVALHEGIAKAEATYRSARAFVQEVWSEVTETLDRGERPSVRQHTLIRLALTNVTAALHDVGNFVYLAGGTTALRRGTIQRLLRDVHAGTQHVTSSPQVVQTCGRELAGLADGQVWRFLDLVEPG